MKAVAVRLNSKGALAIRKGHPWVFSASIERFSKPPESGDAAVIFDAGGKHWLGVGICDPESPVAVRVLTIRRSDPPVGPELFRVLLERALERRAGKIPENTTAWRVLNGESDAFSGLVADKYDSAVVLKIYSRAWVPHAEVLRKVLTETVPGVTRSVLRFSRELRGCGCTESGNPEGEIVEFLENGLRFRADIVRGQKTGFFLDQRDNRARVGALSRGQRVLNVFSFSGGFSLYAARGGAVETVSVDADPHALQECARHFEMNADIPEIRSCRHSELCGDAFEIMRNLRAEGKKFGIVIVDPPSFAKSSKETAQALNTYSRLAVLAVNLVEPHGTLVFASCSSRVSAEDLFARITAAASSAGRPLKVFDKTYHAADHPALFAESSYLKCLYAHV